MDIKEAHEKYRSLEGTARVMKNIQKLLRKGHFPGSLCKHVEEAMELAKAFEKSSKDQLPAAKKEFEDVQKELQRIAKEDVESKTETPKAG